MSEKEKDKILEIWLKNINKELVLKELKKIKKWKRKKFLLTTKKNY